jgi:hypothetical protein
MKEEKKSAWALKRKEGFWDLGLGAWDMGIGNGNWDK